MKPIRTEKDYRRAIERIDRLVAQPDAESNEELELLTILVMAYEAEHVPTCRWTRSNTSRLRCRIVG